MFKWSFGFSTYGFLQGTPPWHCLQPGFICSFMVLPLGHKPNHPNSYIKRHFYGHNSKIKVSSENFAIPLSVRSLSERCRIPECLGRKGPSTPPGSNLPVWTGTPSPPRRCKPEPHFALHGAFPSIRSLGNQEADDTFLERWLVPK